MEWRRQPELHALEREGLLRLIPDLLFDILCHCGKPLASHLPLKPVPGCPSDELLQNPHGDGIAQNGGFRGAAAERRVGVDDTMASLLLTSPSLNRYLQHPPPVGGVGRESLKALPLRVHTGFQLFQRVGNPIFARLFFSSSR